MTLRPGEPHRQCGTRASRAFRFLLLALALAPAASAGAQDADFDGGPFDAAQMIEWAAASSKHFCMVVVGNPGEMAPAMGNTALSSKVAGGYPGTAEITTTNSSFRASVFPPAGFLSSPNLPGPVTFDADFSGTGATNFFNAPAFAEVKIKRGLTSISANLTATINGGAFAAGYYQAELTLRCE